MHRIYQPAEDSYFLSDALKNELKKISAKNKSKLRFLEIGAGTGMQLETAFVSGIKKENILAVDINLQAVKSCKTKGFQCIRSNLFQNIPKSEKFDIILFNPPYLPAHKFDKQKDTTGGKIGNEIINRFLQQAKIHLKNKGFILLLTSSQTPKCNDRNYTKKLLATKKLFFEELYVWKLKKF